MTAMQTIDEATSLDLTPRQPRDDTKLKELILYVSWMSEADPTFGATKLNKILFFSDFRSYAELGAAITGQEYRALPQGPAPRELVGVREQLRAEGALVIREADFYGKRQSQTIALRAPDLSGFGSRQIAIVDRVVQEWWGRTASETSRASHEFVGWQLADIDETIPYQTALFEDHEVSDEESRTALELEDLAAQSLSELTG